MGAIESGGQARGVHAASTTAKLGRLFLGSAAGSSTVKRAEARAPARIDRHFWSPSALPPGYFRVFFAVRRLAIFSA